MRIGPTEATVLNMVEKEEKHASPLLFSLSNLQILMNKKFKYSPKETLQGVQKLYEKMAFLSAYRLYLHHAKRIFLT